MKAVSRYVKTCDKDFKFMNNKNSGGKRVQNKRIYRIDCRRERLAPPSPFWSKKWLILIIYYKIFVSSIVELRPAHLLYHQNDLTRGGICPLPVFFLIAPKRLNFLWWSYHDFEFFYLCTTSKSLGRIGSPEMTSSSCFSKAPIDFFAIFKFKISYKKSSRCFANDRNVVSK